MEGLAMTIHLRSIGIGILIAIALMLILTGEVDAARIAAHTHAASVTHALVDI